MALEFTDESKMPFGTHKGKKLLDVPDDYLKWVWLENREQYLNEETMPVTTAALMKYIEDNLDSIEVDDE